MSAKNTRPSYAKVMTELGTFVYPKLNKPDQFKDGKPNYNVKLRLPADASAALINKIEAELAAYWPVAKAELEEKVASAKTGPEKAKAKKALEAMKEADKSYKPAYDDDGNETGEFEFNFKMPASYTKDKGKPTEKQVPMRPDIFDARGRLLEDPPEIWGGTTGYVSGELRPFSTTVGVGISLRLKGVQIITLRQGGGSRDAESHGFKSHDEGYAAEDTPAESHGFKDQSGEAGEQAGDEDF